MCRDFPQSTCGFVMHVAVYGETDKLVTLYSQTLGRMTAIAKGALKSRQRFVNKLELYSHLRVFCQPPRNGSGLHLLKEAELLDAHLTLRQDYRRYIAAAHFGELLLRFTREHDPDPDLYALIAWTLHALCDNGQPLKIMVFALLHLLGLLGYRPELTRCCQCRSAVHAGQTYLLLPGSGALLCERCYPGSTPFPRLSVQTLRALAGAQSTRLERLKQRQLTQHNIYEALNALHTYALHLLQQDIHSRRLLWLLQPGPGMAGTSPSPSMPKSSLL